jgi:hypothetical protein
MNRNRAAAPIVATVNEKMLSTALYWKIDNAGIADPKKKTLSVIASPVSMSWKNCRRLTRVTTAGKLSG